MNNTDAMIRPLRSVEDMERAEELQLLVWPGSEIAITPSHLLLAIAHNGGVVLGAFDGDTLIGIVMGFLGTDPMSPGRVAMARLKHCSHLLGVHPRYRNRGIGYRLKLAQRQAVMKDGIRLITWTYDPLMSTNAHLNIRLLASICQAYLRDVYGMLRDELNLGIATDRFQVEWWITSSRVDSRVDNQRPPLDLANYLSAGALKLNPSSLNEQDLLVPSDEWFTPDGNLLLVEIPPDYLLMKQKDIELARAWRLHTREIFERVFSDGYIVTDFVYLKGEQVPRSYYVLSHGESRLG
jgi:predicted GNAT superfamily acetyltransferase